MNKHDRDDPKLFEFGAHFRYRDICAKLKIIALERMQAEKQKKTKTTSITNVATSNHISNKPSSIILPIIQNNKTRNKALDKSLVNKQTFNKSNKYLTTMSKITMSYDNLYMKYKSKKL